MALDSHTLIGQSVLIVVDIQGGGATSDGKASAIPFMPGYLHAMDRAPALVRAPRTADVPVIFV